MSLKEDALKIGGAFLAGGIASYLVFKIVVPKVAIIFTSLESQKSVFSKTQPINVLTKTENDQKPPGSSRNDQKRPGNKQTTNKSA